MFLAASPVCAACTGQSLCVPACHSMLVSLSDRIDTSRDLARLERTARVVIAQAHPPIAVETTIPAPAPAAVQVKLAIDTPAQGMLDALPVRVAKVMRPLLKHGLDTKARYSLAAGKNPFDETTPRWLQLAGECLLAGGMTKAELRERYAREFGWSAGTANSRTAIVSALLPALRIAAVTHDRIMPAPRAVVKN
ncbi:hypothetical protein [Paraburkholderia sp. RCC_158]|uniref:hypothetical protein n=1 Tax=Paraburkholderia sp. RCC_158 TaxID=3239220 RepID=UPI00352512CC